MANVTGRIERVSFKKNSDMNTETHFDYFASCTSHLMGRKNNIFLQFIKPSRLSIPLGLVSADGPVIFEQTQYLALSCPKSDAKLSKIFECSH